MKDMAITLNCDNFTSKQLMRIACPSCKTYDNWELEYGGTYVMCQNCRITKSKDKVSYVFYGDTNSNIGLGYASYIFDGNISYVCYFGNDGKHIQSVIGKNTNQENFAHDHFENDRVEIADTLHFEYMKGRAVKLFKYDNF